MARINSSRDSWSAVRDPETDEYVSLDDDVDQEVADRLVERYDPLSIDDDGDSDDSNDDGGELDGLLDGTVDEVEDALESGEYDDQLDDVESGADRVGVEDAVAARRDELDAEDED